MAGSLYRGDYQCGSRKERSVTNNLFTLQITLENIYEFNFDSSLLYTDFKQSHDSVNNTYFCEVHSTYKWSWDEAMHCQQFV